MNVVNQLEASLRLHNFAVALSDLAFFARVHETVPRPDGWEDAKRSQVQATSAVAGGITHRLTDGDWPAGVTADEVKRLTRSARSDALELITLLSDDGRWGVRYYSWQGEADRRVVDRVESAAVRLRELVGRFEDHERDTSVALHQPPMTATPANQSPPDPPPSAEADDWVAFCRGRLLCSPGFAVARRVSDGDQFSFTRNQRRVIEHIATRYARREQFSGEELFRASTSGATERSIRDVFYTSGRPHPAWNDLIVEVDEQQGFYTLRL